jgi:hypothetical protein
MPKKPKALYHFTSRYHLKGIMSQGLIRGDVPTSPMEGFNAIWLTSDPDAGAQGWSAGTVFNKTEVRLTVSVPDIAKLKHWPSLAKKLSVDPGWYHALDEAGGGGSDNWYVYMGTIPPENIEAIERKEGK